MIKIEARWIRIGFFVKELSLSQSRKLGTLMEDSLRVEKTR